MAKANPKAPWVTTTNRANHAEKYLRWFVDFCPSAIAMFDCNLNYVLVSQPWVKMLGIPRLKLIGTNIYESLPVALSHRQGLERCLIGGQMHYSAEVRIGVRGESANNFQLAVQPWYTDDGSAGGIIIASYAIDRQSEVLEQRLQEEILERQYFEDAFTKIGTALESTNDAICITDRTGQPIYINSAFSDLFAYSLSALQKPNQFAELFTEIQLFQAIHAAVNYGGTWSGELELRDRDQKHIPISLRVNPVKSPNGSVIGMTYVCTNISDRKAAEAEINKSFAALGATLEATADSILVLDAIGNIIICNQKFVDMWRIPSHIFTSDDAHILQYVTERIKSSQYLHNFGKHLSSEQNSFEIVELEDGRTLECYSQPQNILNSCAGRVWSLRDITERLAAEAIVKASEEKYRLQAEKLESALQNLKNTQAQLIQAEKMSGLGQLVAGIAHEINNPVNFIYGNLTYADNYTQDLLSLIETYRNQYPHPNQVIQDKLEEIDIDFLVTDFVKLISSIKVGAERIQQIVKSLNKFSRSDESGCKYVDIHEGIDSTLMILQSRLKANSHRPEIVIKKHYGNLPAICCYAGQLNQVFMNLLTNAIDALEEDNQANGNWQVMDDKPQWIRKDGKVSIISITTEVQNVNQSCDRLIVRIADNGKGIPQELSNRLFDLFFTTKPVGKGTGLGLSLAYQIVTENHGGKLSFNSEIGKGTEFVIEIPLKQPKAI
ncbi:ATP-binding protein [Pseudanabaena sp. Chao 1811]|uniref:ATP-binding protein n=1 Tax=Pseudanabaena sp. Chao 1811 TaxID=2963092 RepID=UPI0022F3CC09|nr:ATP-binding protein [Pseudanabaena sp. Chao 1811]